MSPGSTPSIEFETTSLEGCPGDELDFAFTIEHAGPDLVPQLTPQLRPDLADSPSRTELSRTTGGTIRGHFYYTIPRDSAPDAGTYQLLLEDSDLGLSATLEVTVPAVSLAPPSFDWKDGKLTASTEVKSCSPLKPEATFTLSCSDGALVLTADIKATVELPGGSSVELDFPQYQQQLGSCSLDFYEDGPAAQPTASHPIEPHQLQPPPPGPPKPRPWKKPLAIAGTLVGGIFLTFAVWPNDGPSPDFNTPTDAVKGITITPGPVVEWAFDVMVDGDGSVEVSYDGDVQDSGSQVSMLVEDGTIVDLTAFPDPGWRFVGWSSRGPPDATLTVDATEDLELVAVFVEPSISHLNCTSEDHGEIVVECTAEALDFGSDPLWIWSAPQSVSLNQPEPSRVEAVFVGEGPRPWHFAVNLDVCDSLETVCLGSDQELTIAGSPDLVVVPNQFDPTHADVELVGSSDGCTTLFGIQNIGDAAAASSTVLVSIFGADTTFNGSAAVPVLSPGEVVPIELFVPTSSFCEHSPDSAGEIQADARGAIEESDETNNTLGWLSIG